MKSPKLLLLAMLVSLTLSPSQAEGQTSPATNLLWKQCNEDVLTFSVDPAPLQDVVEPDFTLRLEEGKASITIVIQDCSGYWVDGKDLGPNQHVHVWTSVEGPEDVRPVVGAELTGPTQTWFSLFAGSTNPRDWEARKPSRTAPVPIQGLSLNPLDSLRGGEVRLGGDETFSWRSPAADPTPQVIGFNHDIYLRDDHGDLVFKRVQGIGNLVGYRAQGTLEIPDGVDLASVVNAGRYPVLVTTLFPIWARGTLGADPPK